MIDRDLPVTNVSYCMRSVYSILDSLPVNDVGQPQERPGLDVVNGRKFPSWWWLRFFIFRWSGLSVETTARPARLVRRSLWAALRCVQPPRCFHSLIRNDRRTARKIAYTLLHTVSKVLYIETRLAINYSKSRDDFLPSQQIDAEMVYNEASEPKRP